MAKMGLLAPPLGRALGALPRSGAAATAPAAPPVTWNPYDRSAETVLTLGNRTTTGTGGSWTGVRATAGLNPLSQMAYFEIHLDSGSANFYMGLADTGQSLTATSMESTYGWCFNLGNKLHAGATAYGSTPAVGDVIMCAVANGKIWFGLNGAWFASGNPAAGTGEAFSGLTVGASLLYPMVLVWSGVTVTARFAAAELGYAPPAGFVPIFPI